jgi:hypothetical protein
LQPSSAALSQLTRLAAWRPSLSSREDGGTTPRQRLWVLLALVAFAAAVAATLLAPGGFLSTQSTSDLWLFLDGGHRVAGGQVPNRDFPSPIGPLVYLFLGISYAWTGSLGEMMPVTAVMFVGMLTPLLLYALLSRLPPLCAVLFGLFIILLAAAPAVIGDVAPKPGFAMFYNRWGWTTLSVMFLFLLPRRPGFGTTLLDALVLAAAWLMLFYVKMTYALVGGAFIASLLAFPHARRTALYAAGSCAAVLLGVELFWHGTAAYLGDIASAIHATGAVRGGAAGLVGLTLNNLQAEYLFAVILLLAWLRGAKLGYLLACAVFGAAGLMLARNNSQGPGIPTFVVLGIVAVLAPATDSPQRRDLDAGLRIAAGLIALALALPIAVGALSSLAYSSLKAPALRVHALDGTPFRGLSASEPPGALRSDVSDEQAMLQAECGTVDPARLLIDSHPKDVSVGQAGSVAVALDGVRLIQSDKRLSGKILAFDTVNPFNALLNRPAPLGSPSFIDADISISGDVHPSPGQMFSDVGVVMVPRKPLKSGTFELLASLYGEPLRRSFKLAARSPCWDAYLRR